MFSGESSGTLSPHVNGSNSSIRAIAASYSFSVLICAIVLQILNVNNFIILRVCADKPDKHMLRREFNYYYQAEIISFYIKHIMLIPNIIHRVEGLFNIRQTLPFRLFCLCIPFIQGRSCLRMNAIVIYNFLSCYYTHIAW